MPKDLEYMMRWDMLFVMVEDYHFELIIEGDFK